MGRTVCAKRSTHCRRKLRPSPVIIHLLNLLWSTAMKTARISSLTRWIMVLITALSLASCGGGNGDHAVATVFDANRSVTDNAFTATLTGAQEVPPGASQAIGAGTVMIDANTRLLRATLTTAGITGTAANIHESPPGVSGPIVFPVSETAPGSGIWTTQATLTDAQLNALRNGNYYFNVQSASNPAGEIRGQILPRLTTPADSEAIGVGTTAAGTTVATVFKNALTGTQEVPPVSTSATAIGTAAVDNVARTLAVAVNTMGITGTEAHVHEAPPGLNGPIVFPLGQTPGGGIWFAKVSLNDAQISSIMAGNYYFEVHSVAFSNGEVRGQIAQLHRRTRLSNCRFGGFGFDDCTFDGTGFFIGLGLDGFEEDGFEEDGFGSGGPGFGVFGAGNNGTGHGAIGGAIGSGTPAPGIFF
jgi:hypothetical protein